MMITDFSFIQASFAVGSRLNAGCEEGIVDVQGSEKQTITSMSATYGIRSQIACLAFLYFYDRTKYVAHEEHLVTVKLFLQIETL